MTTNTNGAGMTPEEIELSIERICHLARQDFGFFRKCIHPEMLTNWWTTDLAVELQQFYDDLKAGQRPKLAIEAPPQHGKSLLATDFICWFAGKEPDLNTIFASYSAELGVRSNRAIKRTIESVRYQQIFPGTVIGRDGWQLNTEVIEYCNSKGSFRNTTVEGAVTGFGLHLGVVDDPIKGRKEANAKTVRDSTWSWFTDDFRSRFADEAGLLLIMTRWHVDDLLGRLIERSGEWDQQQNLQGIKVLRYRAIAERSTKFRREGEALFPELKSLDFLLTRKKELTEAGWESLYQQNPIVVGGGQLPVDKLQIRPYWDRSNIAASIRYWDKAATSNSEHASYSAGVLMHRLYDHTYVIEDIVRGQWNALDREQRIKSVTRSDAAMCYNYEVWVEQEPGSGGKESAENTLRNLAGYRAFAERVTGSKEERAQPFAAQVQAANVFLIAGPWVKHFQDECEEWPHGKRSDQIDAAAGAFNKLSTRTRYNLNLAEWAL